MKKVGVAILGLGVVGSGTYKILKNNREYYKKIHNIDIEVECILEINKQRALDLGINEEKVCTNIQEVLSNPNVDIVIEVIGGITFARNFVSASLKNGKTVVTSNKELYCKYSHELEAIAKKMDVGLFFEASCVGGVPIIRTLTDGTQANNILSITGIINGTTNYILTKMSDEGASYQDVLKEAQALGYAEANPSADVDGFDSTYKLSILSSLAFNTKVPYDKIYREGITNITKEDIAYGKELGYTIKLLGIGKNTEKGIEVRVHPTFIKNTHPLAAVKDSFNAVYIVGDSVGDIMLYGRGAGEMPTGSAIVSDVIFAAKYHGHNPSTFENTEKADPKTKFVNDFESKYYIKCTAKDKAGVLAKVAGIFAKFNVSITDVIQKSTNQSTVPLIFITHKTNEIALQKAVKMINELDDIASVDSIIRVENK